MEKKQSQETAGRPDDQRRKWFILLAVGIGTFMSALDSSVVNTILPVVRNTFQSDVASIEWVVLIYLLVVSGLLLTFGRLGDLRGHRRIYLSGFMIFVLSSALCGLAPRAELLVLFRAFQGFGAAMLFANSPAILTSSFPAAERGRALGLQAMMTYLGLTVGPSLGGWLTHVFSWRAVFYINVPVGLTALILSWIFIAPDRQDQREERFDLLGAGLFLGGLVALLLALNEGSEWGWRTAPILGLLGAAVVLMGFFIVWEKRVRWPMLDLSLFRSPVFTFSVISAVGNYIALYVILFLLPFYLIQGRGLNSAQAGLILTAQPIIMALVAPISGSFSDRVGQRLPATLGMIILAAGLFGMTQLNPTTPLGWAAAGMAVCGLGTGIFAAPNNSALMGSAPPSRQGIAAGALATARNVGMALGIGIGGAILTSYQVHLGDAGLFPAVQMGFLAAAISAIAAAVASAVRGSL